jgi:hypothetical protein
MCDELIIKVIYPDDFTEKEKELIRKEVQKRAAFYNRIVKEIRRGRRVSEIHLTSDANAPTPVDQECQSKTGERSLSLLIGCGTLLSLSSYLVCLSAPWVA